MTDLTGKIAVVTGATQGIGHAVALRLASEGAHVVLVARRSAQLAAVQQEITKAGGVASFDTADLSDPGSVRSLTDRITATHPRVDILADCGGIFRRGTFSTATAEDLDEIHRTNVRGVFILTKGLLSAMTARGGDIVFVNSSIVFSDGAAAAAYAAAEHALLGLADALRAEYNEKGIRVLTIHPGRTATPLQARLFQDEGRAYDPARLLQPEDVAEAIVGCLKLPETAEVTHMRIRPRRKY